MNKIIFPLLGMITFSSGLSASDEIMKVVEKIHWIEQAAVKIDIGKKSVWIDPYKVEKSDKTDIILITHSHHDHLSIDDIQKITGPKTVFVAPTDCAKTLGEKFKNKIVVSEPGMKTDIQNIHIEAVPAYNVIKTKFHPKENKWVGYLLDVDGVKVYHTGDTERIPEMKSIKCDIILLPLGQTYTMNSVDEAAEAVLDVKAKIAIPIHYGLYEGKSKDVVTFANVLKDKVKVVIKQKGK